MPIQRRVVLTLWTLSMVVASDAALAQADVRGAKDHPLLTRYPNSYVTEFAKNYNTVEFAVGTGADGQPRRQAVEGNATVLTYFHKNPEKQPSALELIRNYQNAVRSIGGSSSRASSARRRRATSSRSWRSRRCSRSSARTSCSTS